MGNTLVKTMTIGAMLLPWVVSLGCFADPDGLRTYKCSGTVSFDGKPVDTGYINFEPNVSQGNSGPGSSAKITQGRYQTLPGKGVVGGAYRVFIVGYDGKSSDGLGDGRPLFPETVIERDLPLEDSVQDFEPPPARK